MRKKIVGISILIILVGIGVILGKKFVYEPVNELSNVTIGKTLYINFEAGDADYLEMLLEEQNADAPSNKVILLNREEVEKLIQYMKDNGVQITPGEYEIPQTSKYEDLLSILKFESEK